MAHSASFGAKTSKKPDLEQIKAVSRYVRPMSRTHSSLKINPNACDPYEFVLILFLFLSQTSWPTWTSHRLTTICWRPARLMRRWVTINQGSLILSKTWPLQQEGDCLSHMEVEQTLFRDEIWYHIHNKVINHNI